MSGIGIGIGIGYGVKRSVQPSIVIEYINRVIADGGIVQLTEAEITQRVNELQPIQDFSLITLNDAGKAGTPGKLYSIVPSTGDGDFSVTRAGDSATRVNAQGVIETVPAGMPRIDFDPVTGEYLGTLVEPQSTNHISNNTMQGAQVGVLGSDGSLPTGWTSSDAGLTIEVLGFANKNGIDYIDIKFFGVATGNFCSIRYTNFQVIFVAQNEQLTQSKFLKLIDNNQPYEAALITFNYFQGTSFVRNTLKPINLTKTLTRYSANDVVGSNVNNIQPFLRINLISTNSYDFTVRIGLPQLEKRQNQTSTIKTTTGTVTRDADVITRTNAADLIGQTQGTIEITFDAGDNYELAMLDFDKTVSGKTTYRLTYSPTEVRHYINGVLEQTDTGVYDWSGMDIIELGHYQNTSFINGHIFNFWTSKEILNL